MDEKRLAEIAARCDTGYVDLGFAEAAMDVIRLRAHIMDQAERIHERYLEGIKDGSRRSSTRITEQAERIKTLEAEVAGVDPPLMTYDAARRETATAIAKIAAEELVRRDCSCKVVIGNICRAHGAKEDPNGQ